MTALDELRVIELGDSVAASVVGMLLSDFGADVVKVEPLEGAKSRCNPGFAAWGRGKRSVTLDASSDCSKDWLAGALRGADICILGPNDDLKSWGTEIVQATTQNKRLIVLQLPAYLSSDETPWFGGQESNSLLSAVSGMASRQASDDGNPVELVLPHLTYVQAAWATASVVAALLERHNSGYGQTVTVSGMNAVMAANVGSMTVDPNKPDPSSAVGGSGRHPTYRPVKAKDGWLASGALGRKFEHQLLRLLGIEYILEDPRLNGDTNNMVLPENQSWCKAKISEAFEREPRDYWIARMQENKIPVGSLLQFEDWLDHPVVEANGLRAEVDDPERGHVTMPGVTIKLTGTPGQVRSAAPKVGQNNGMDVWPSQPEVDGLPRMVAGPLNGYRVLDTGTFVATPYAGFMLAELGAEVIKVEPTTGDPFRSTAFAFNRGMKSLAIDLKSCDGVDAFLKVVENADVIIDGMRPGAMAKLGIDYDSLKMRKPDIITMSLAAFGMHGDMAEQGGVDMVLQAMSGMMFKQGSPNDPVYNTIAIIDVTTSALSVLASLLALYHRERTGQGQRTWNSLAGTATYLGLGEYVRYIGREPVAHGGKDFKGSENRPLNHLYRVADGWIAVQSTDANEIAIDDLRTAGIEVQEISTDSLACALEGKTREEAVAAFNRAEIPSVPVRGIAESFRDEALIRDEIIHLRQSDHGYAMAVPGKYADFSRTQRRGPLTPPGIGQHSSEVLEASGVSRSNIDKLLATSMVAESGPGTVELGAVYR